MKLLTREDKVKEFVGPGIRLKDVFFIQRLIDEEVDEFAEAAQNYYDSPTDENRAAMIKEWADVQYVLSQAAVFYTFDGEEAFNRVHDSNMSKFDDHGNRILRADGKILKGPNYREPDMKGL